MFPQGTELAGRYKLRRLLGAGGMGTVYEASHAIVGRKVAVKVLHPRLARAPELVARFVREAQSAAAVGHKNIVDVLDFGSHDGVPFLVMELLDGEDAGVLLERVGNLPPGEACWVASEVLSALAAAHKAGVVHRDLKPDNVFLTRDASGVGVRLLDFGIARFRADGAEILTAADVVLGTPRYMAPEQLAHSASVDHRADLYALGVLLYELLTGVIPRRIPDAEEPLETPAEPPSSRVEGLPAGLDAVVLRAFADAPDARFQSADAFREALAPFVGGPPELGPPRASSSPELEVAPPPTTVPTLVGENPDRPPTQSLKVPRRSLRPMVLGALGLLIVPLGLGLRHILTPPDMPPPAHTSTHPSLRTPPSRTAPPPAAPRLPVAPATQETPTPAPAHVVAVPITDAGVERRPRRGRHGDRMVRQF
ncbi:MAG: serine/threonine protein kinase [Deltaproteobacteria bacterium]|nr:serine/threonine protein kinase [Deltaproteobacteria bacterium]